MRIVLFTIKMQRNTVERIAFSLLTIVSFIAAGLFHQKLYAQEPNPVYIDNLIPTVRIIIDPDSLNVILAPENAESDYEFPAVFIFDNSTAVDTVENIGFRLRGNTSRYAQKKSFKVSFNSFEKGRKYYGFEKLNLNGEHNDPSIIRSKLCWNLFNSLQIPSSRANHVKLYINDVYYGLYINVEHIDENFVKDRFGNNGGNLYKCLWPADLDYRGSDPDLYKFTSGNRRTYELKTNTDLDDYSDLSDFIESLNFIPDSLFYEFEKMFNVDGYLRILAVDVAVGSWDDYWYLKNNYYLYYNPETALFEFIPYDYDNTFGIDWVGPDWGHRDIYAWGHDSEARPLATRILAVQEYRDRYSYYLNKLLHGAFQPDSLFPRIDAIHAMIASAAEQDTFRSLDYGYDFDDFNNSYEQALGGHVEYGLKSYITTRRNSILAQLQLHDIPPIIKNVRYSPAIAQANQVIDVTAYIEDEDPNPVVQIYYALNAQNGSPVSMFDDGLHQDGQAGDLIYGGQIPAADTNGTIRFYISATDAGNAQSLIPRNAPAEQFSVKVGFEAPKLFINEFMASNESTVSDAFDDFDDWIEIYNDDTAAVWLGDKFLTDNLTNPAKWSLPDTTLQPGAFLLIWADDEPEQGPNHATFKLSANGEAVGIFQAQGESFVAIDSVTFGQQQTDMSFGRSLDGGPEWQHFANPTPGYSNEIVNAIVENTNSQPGQFALEQNYPNPFNPSTTIQFAIPIQSDVSVKVFDIFGREVATLVDETLAAGKYKVHFERNSLPNGTYFYRLVTDQFSQTKKLILLK